VADTALRDNIQLAIGNIPHEARRHRSARRFGGALAALLGATLLSPSLAFAMGGDTSGIAPDFTATWFGIVAILVFVIAYGLVIGEEVLHLRKSKPVIIAAGIIWALIGIAFALHGDTTTAGEAIRHNLLEFGELMLFLLAAMTFINTLEERNVFSALRAWLVSSGFSLHTIFWLTGLLAFFISPVADNLTTALLMAAVVMAVARDNQQFVILGCINIVVAANAGGAFSPFGDITTLMVWQKGIVQFSEFFALFLPSAVNWLVPAVFMSMALRKGMPAAVTETVEVKQGGFVVIGLFAFTIVLAVCSHNFLHLPPVLGMMTGLGLLKVYGYFLKRSWRAPEGPEGPEEMGLQSEFSAKLQRIRANSGRGYRGRRFAYRSVGAAAVTADALAVPAAPQSSNGAARAEAGPFDIFDQLRRAEWDTLMFFYGVILCVGGLGTLGYLAMISEAMYVGLGPTWANVLVGVLSAVVDNIPVMFAVLTMMPDMPLDQWLLVTLTAGVGGSMLSIGSAAGVALMGQARGVYTFFAHLRWTWAIALGYVASIVTHLAL
jgi:Na+/H+ antiporter NhaD/arsenite permease-like protein